MRERRLQDEAETKLAAALAEVGGDRKELLRRLLGKPAAAAQDGALTEPTSGKEVI